MKVIDELNIDQATPMPANGDEKIIVSDTSFECLIEGFLQNGYRITQENEDRGYFNCEKVADHQTYIRHVVKITDGTGTIISEWRSGIVENQLEWAVSKFRLEGGRATYSILSGLKAVENCGAIRFE